MELSVIVDWKTPPGAWAGAVDAEIVNVGFSTETFADPVAGK
jgi:hypothetical protein